MLPIETILPFVAAAALTAPSLDGPSIRELRPFGAGSTLVLELFVAPDHTVEACRVVFSDYSGAANRRVCDKALGLKVAVVATDADGNPVHGFVTVARMTRTSSGRSPPPQVPPPAVLQVGVRDLPGRDGRKSISVLTLVDREGAITQCQQTSPDDGNLARMACAQAGSHRWDIRRDRTGIAVPYVTSLRVDFIEQPAEQ